MSAKKIRGNLPLVLLLVLVAFSLVAGSASAQFDDETRIKPPTDGANVPGDHGGGDPDNPVPLLGGGHMVMSDMGYDYQSVYVGTAAGALSKEDFFRIVMAVSGIVGEVLLF